MFVQLEWGSQNPDTHLSKLNFVQIFLSLQILNICFLLRQFLYNSIFFIKNVVTKGDLGLDYVDQRKSQQKRNFL